MAYALPKKPTRRYIPPKGSDTNSWSAPETKGAVVPDVDLGLHDARSRLREGDVIGEVKTSGSGSTPIGNVGDFQKATRGLKEGDSVMLLVQREGSSFFIAFEIGA